jgi:cellulose 1,4-beta-cellobiosidase
MPADGGVSATNKAGTKYGTGYCDAQCPKDIKFIAGKRPFTSVMGGWLFF